MAWIYHVFSAERLSGEATCLEVIVNHFAFTSQPGWLSRLPPATSMRRQSIFIIKNSFLLFYLF